MMKERIAQTSDAQKTFAMRENLIKHMVDRFLGWTLPEDFSPDDGISFERSKKPNGDPYPMPTGTNLFDATQATEMVRRMIEDFNLR